MAPEQIANQPHGSLLQHTSSPYGLLVLYKPFRLVNLESHSMLVGDVDIVAPGVLHRSRAGLEQSFIESTN